MAGLAVDVFTLTSQTAEARRYQIVLGESSVRIHLGTAGLLKGLGHEHEIAARAFSGHVDVASSDLAGSQVSVTFDSGGLQVLPDHEPPKDIAKVQQEMLGPKVLDSRRYPRITVTSRQSMAKPVGPRVFDVQLGCDLELHGVVRPISLPLRVTITDDRLEARGTTTIRQTDFGIKPVNAAGGTIKVKNEVTIRFTFVGRAEQG